MFNTKYTYAGTSPCLNCKDRYIKINDNGNIERCHSSCKKYKLYRNEVDSYNDKRDKKIEVENLFIDMYYRNQKKNNARKSKKEKKY